MDTIKFLIYIYIYMFPTLIQLKESISGIQHCVKVVVKWISNSNNPFVLPLTSDNQY